MEQGKWKKILLAVAGFLTVLAGGYEANEMFGGRTDEKERTLMDQVAATTTATGILVNDFRNIGVTVAATATSGTLKFYCSLADTEPTWSSAQSATNRYDTVEIVDTQNGATIDGDTGIVFTNTTDVRQFEINTNNFRYCTAVLSPWTAGTTTVKFRPVNNQ